MVSVKGAPADHDTQSCWPRYTSNWAWICYFSWYQIVAIPKRWVDYYHYYNSLGVFHISIWSLKDSKSPQIFRALLRILADLNNAVVWKVTTHLLMVLLVTVSRTPITIDIIVTFVFHIFFNLLSFFSLSFKFYSVVSRDSKVRNFANSFLLLLIIKKSGCLAKITWSVSNLVEIKWSVSIIIIIYSSRVFHISISWFFFFFSTRFSEKLKIGKLQDWTKFPRKYGRPDNSTTYCSDTATQYTIKIR